MTRKEEIEIEREAEEYADSDYVNNNFRDRPFSTHANAFTAGVNSKVAEKIKLEFAI